MYKQPDNSNRVKSIKSKFENFENVINNNNINSKSTVVAAATTTTSSSGNIGTNNNNNIINNSNKIYKTENNLIDTTNNNNTVVATAANKLHLSRQLSDPSKRNIKRTPAFRLDKNSDKSNVFLQRNSINHNNRSHYIENKVKQLNNNCTISALRTDCDNNNGRGAGGGAAAVDDDAGGDSTACSTSPPQNLRRIDEKSVVKVIKDNNSKSINMTAKPVLIKSKSSHDFAYIRSKFDNKSNNNVNTNEIIINNKKTNNTDENNQRDDYNLLLKSNNKTNNDDELLLLYTEPIPKSLRQNDNHKRQQNCDKHIYTNVENNSHCGIISSAVNISSDQDSTRYGSAAATLKLCDKNMAKNNNCSKTVKESSGDITHLTDTLKSALKRPLPLGPPPKKPPRTFIHSPKFGEHSPDQIARNLSFLHLTTKPDKVQIVADASPVIKTKTKRNDPFYKLNKLENAFRNNKLRFRKPIKTELSSSMAISTTSGEDSDDSLQKRHLPAIPSQFTNNNNRDDIDELSQSFNFNCLNGLSSCTASAPYERIKESNSSFFVDCKTDTKGVVEPVYAEPFHFRNAGELENRTADGKGGNRNSGKNIRNSLYYMSTPVLSGNEKLNDEQEMMDHHRASSQNAGESVHQKEMQSSIIINSSETNRINNKQQISTSENSSLSSFTSDLDSPATLTPLDETAPQPFVEPVKIKHLIEAFEAKPPVATTPRNNNNNESLNLQHRLDDLKVSLQKTLDDHLMVGCNATNTDSTNNNNNGCDAIDRKYSVHTIIDKFQTYVKNVPKYGKPRTNRNNNYLFYCCLIVQWDNEKAQIKFKFPKDVEVPQKIENLCFPEAASGPLDQSNNAQCYSLVITNDKGERTFGYCRRVIPEGSDNCLPLTYCILSKHRALRFYKKILIELETRHGIADKLRDELINEFYYKKFPLPGESIRIDLTNIMNDIIIARASTILKFGGKTSGKSNDLDLTSSCVNKITAGGYGTIDNKKKSTNSGITTKRKADNDDEKAPSPNLIIDNKEQTELVLTLHHDTRYEDADLQQFHKLPPTILLKIFASLLLERKVILISCVISKLSSCVDCLQSILYPLSWPHTFIPILPQCLWDVVESPTPVICGILSVAVVNEHHIENGIVVDLDEGSVLIDEGDEDKILTGSMQKMWFKGLALANTVPPENYVHAVHLSDAYLRVFITCLGNYKSFIVDGNFQKESFIQNGKTKNIRRFLKWFTETNLFLTFIDTVLNDPTSFILFDKKIEMLGTEESNVILDKLIGWNKR